MGLAACGDDDESKCESAGAELCDRACECAEGDACAFTDSAGAFTLTFDNAAECRALLTAGCGMSSGGGTPPDYDACEAAIGSAMCVMTADGQALASPAACDSMM